jgi:squalene-associated FAD-dependent desaturase
LKARRVCVVGGGWAGIAAAVTAAAAGDQVTLLEMAPQLGGRARGVELDGAMLDNGQHILIGAYTATLALMRRVGADPGELLERRPLELIYPDGSGLRLPPGPPVSAFVRGVLRARAWSVRERAALLGAAGGWLARGFRCAPDRTVAQLTARVSPRLREEVLEPLCIAALNTPPAQASAAVFLRVLRDALFSGAGSADLLLPRRPLSQLLPDPAHRWLVARGASVRTATRARELVRDAAQWRVDGEAFEHVVLATTPQEAARLAGGIAPGWAAAAAAFAYEPIVTVYLRSAGSRLPQPMTALRGGADAPAQFLFDHGALGGAPGLFAAVASSASAWVARGADATAEAALRQLVAFPPGTWRSPPTVVRTLTEKRGTFLCTPAVRRPAATIAPGLAAAGDFVQGPYPATLEGAVRAGISAVT